jgi:hypothetical protein
MGSRQSDLGVIPGVRVPVYIEEEFMGTIMDHKPFLNIKPFGQCKSLANPTVAAATAANYGRLQPMPCVPNTATPWIGGKMNVLISNEPTLLDSSKLMCAWMGMIEITNPGQDFVMEGAESLHSPADSIKSEKKAKDVAVAVGESEEKEKTKELTVKDFVEILKKIEEKQGYEAARHYAANNIDYWKINELAMKYIKETDEKKKDEEKDNDPNQMPSRFMLLYGADDDELHRQGNIDDHPDNFENLPEEKQQQISVNMLRKGLKLLRYDIEDAGPFDDMVYHAFLQYHWRRGRVNLEDVYEDSADHEKPLHRIADKYGAFTWKYFHDKYNSKIDHQRIIEELNDEYGDELLAEKGADPQMYKPGVAYHYMWVPFHAILKMGEEFKSEEEIEVQIFDGEGMILVEGSTVRD